MISITDSKKKKKMRLWAVIFWLLIWEAASIAIGQEILLVSPVDVLIRLGELVVTAEFWQSVGFSIAKIAGGFLLAVAAGTVCAALAGRYKRFGELLEPFVQTVKAIPVASFVILVLIWISSSDLSIVISFLMVFPIIYTNMYEGIANMDKQLLEMADVFGMKGKDRFKYIYISQVLPFFRSACSVTLGMCWKAGVAAEVIGLPDRTIGENLYEAKIFLDTASLFAWTVVIICISVLFEKIFMGFINKGASYIERSI